MGNNVGGYRPPPIVSSPSPLPYLPMFPSPIPLAFQGPLFPPSVNGQEEGALLAVQEFQRTSLYGNG